MSPRRLLQLRDGRFLSYHLAGWWPKAPDSSSDTAAAAAPDAAATVIYHHGWPSSAAEVGAWHQAAAEQRVQVVAIDRPGVAASTFYLQGALIAAAAAAAASAKAAAVTISTAQHLPVCSKVA
jgi:pimeloyl-ACP methyl ester carboxylesterase